MIRTITFVVKPGEGRGKKIIGILKNAAKLSNRKWSDTKTSVLNARTGIFGRYIWVEQHKSLAAAEEYEKKRDSDAEWNALIQELFSLGTFDGEVTEYDEVDLAE